MKDLKKEYEQMLLEDIPDIWDRIEANLPTEDMEPEQSAVTPITPDSKIKTFTPETTEKTTPVKKFNKTKILRWATVFAACLCVLIILPLMNTDRSMNESASAPAENVAGYAETNALTSGSKSQSADSAENVAAAPAKDYMADGAAEEYVENMEEAKAAAPEYEEAPAEAVEAEDTNRNTTSEEETLLTKGDEDIDEVIAQITDTLVEDELVIGYQIMVLEESRYFYENDTIEVYFADEYAGSSFEISTDPAQNEHLMHIIYNTETSRYEIVDME